MVLFHIQEAFMRPSRLVKDVMRNLVYCYQTSIVNGARIIRDDVWEDDIRCGAAG